MLPYRGFFVHDQAWSSNEEQATLIEAMILLKATCMWTPRFKALNRKLGWAQDRNSGLELEGVLVTVP